MARSRNLKPGLYLNDDLAKCSIWARYLFPGLWTLADRDGKLEDRPVRIKAALLPYDKQNVNELLEELHQEGFILRYSVNEDNFIYILNFRKHQNPHCKEPASTIPDPPSDRPHSGQALGKSGASTGPTPDENSSGPADSLLPLTDSLSPSPSTPPGGADFDEFWNVYPRKVEKIKARKAFAKLKPDRHLLDLILADVRRRTPTNDWQKENGQFIPYPASYLNGRRWEDEDGLKNGQHVDPAQRYAHDPELARRYAPQRSDEDLDS